MNKFSETLTYYRQLSKLTQRQLAALLNVTPNNIGHWEKGRTEPNLDTLIKLSEIFNLSIDELIKGQ